MLVAWLLAMARREALKRGRKGLASALPLVGAATVAFLLAISPVSPQVSNISLLAALLFLAGAIGLVLWRGFRG